jgi:hypothetical protein
MGAFNSREFEFADVRVQLLGAELSGLRGLVYKKSREKEPVYGAGADPKSIQRGNKSYEGTLTVLKSDLDALNRAAIAAGYEDIVEVPSKNIVITCVYEKQGDVGVSTVSCIGVEFTEYEDGMKQGDKFKEVELPFIFLRLKQA